MEIFGGNAPCKYGRKDGGFLARPDPKTGTKIGKPGANHFFAIAKPVNDTNQSGQSVLPIIRQVNKMIINVEMAAI